MVSLILYPTLSSFILLYTFVILQIKSAFKLSNIKITAYIVFEKLTFDMASQVQPIGSVENKRPGQVRSGQLRSLGVKAGIFCAVCECIQVKVMKSCHASHHTNQSKNKTSQGTLLEASRNSHDLFLVSCLRTRLVWNVNMFTHALGIA